MSSTLQSFKKWIVFLFCRFSIGDPSIGAKLFSVSSKFKAMFGFLFVYSCSKISYDLWDTELLEEKSFSDFFDFSWTKFFAMFCLIFCFRISDGL